MTNLFAAIIVTVGTNWTTVGTFTPSGSTFASHDVQEGKRVTNYTAILEWKGERKEMIVETQVGESVGERKIARGIHFYSGATNIIWPGSIMFTNGIIQNSILLGAESETLENKRGLEGWGTHK